MASSPVKPEIVFLHEAFDIEDDNVDVLIRLPNEEVRTATFFTIKNIASIMGRYESTGECAAGAYFWARDLVIVKDLRRDTIESVIADMVENGEYVHAYGISTNERGGSN